MKIRSNRNVGPSEFYINSTRSRRNSSMMAGTGNNLSPTYEYMNEEYKLGKVKQKSEYFINEKQVYEISPEDAKKQSEDFVAPAISLYNNLIHNDKSDKKTAFKIDLVEFNKQMASENILMNVDQKNNFALNSKNYDNYNPNNPRGNTQDNIKIFGDDVIEITHESDLNMEKNLLLKSKVSANSNEQCSSDLKESIQFRNKFITNYLQYKNTNYDYNKIKNMITDINTSKHKNRNLAMDEDSLGFMMDQLHYEKDINRHDKSMYNSDSINLEDNDGTDEEVSINKPLISDDLFNEIFDKNPTKN